MSAALRAAMPHTDRQLRPALRWTLWAVLGACALVVGLDLDEPPIAAAARTPSTAGPDTMVTRGERAPAADVPARATAPIPTRLPVFGLQAPARFDPFRLAVAVPRTPPSAPASAATLTPAFAPARPIEWRYAGRIVAPDGSLVVLIAGRSRTHWAKLGDSLPDGHVIRGISDDAVQLRRPDSQPDVVLRAEGATSAGSVR